MSGPQAIGRLPGAAITIASITTSNRMLETGGPPPKREQDETDER